MQIPRRAQFLETAIQEFFNKLLGEGEERAWTVPCVPAEHCERSDNLCVALRIRSRQGELFADGSAVKQFAVVTNRRYWKGQRLLH